MRKRPRQSAGPVNFALNPQPSSPLNSVVSCPCSSSPTPFRSRFGPGAQCSDNANQITPTSTHRLTPTAATKSSGHAYGTLCRGILVGQARGAIILSLRYNAQTWKSEGLLWSDGTQSAAGSKPSQGFFSRFLARIRSSGTRPASHTRRKMNVSDVPFSYKANY